MSEYFTHDFKARHDPKIINLIMRHGMTGVGIYWCLIEMLHEEGGYISLSECERIAFELRTDIDKIKSVIYDFELFKNDDKIMYSESALLRIEIRKNKSTKASESANARWDKANAMRTQCDGNAKKKRKGKEIKGNGKENKIIDISVIDSIYSMYPTKCSIRNASNGKCEKNKEQIKKLLDKYSETELKTIIENYVKNCTATKTYMKNFTTFLNNIPVDLLNSIPETDKLQQKEKMYYQGAEISGFKDDGKPIFKCLQ
jgi:hypothetical protein